MGSKVAFATSSEYPELHPDDRLAVQALAERGIDVTAEQWGDSSVGWERYGAVVIRSCWDYFTRADEFKAWLRRLDAQGVRVLNPPAVVLANMDKRYLRDLEARGAETVPTAWLDPGESSRTEAFIRALPWEQVVVKPAVSAGAFRTTRTTRSALLQDSAPLSEVLQGSTALVQPYLAEIERDGEWSFLFFGERFSHAVVKRPKPGDFRVQWRHGGSHGKANPPAALVQEVARVRALLPPGRLYTRIDGVVALGRFLLVEVELIEPYLFFAEDPGAPARFAEALAEVLTSSSPT